LSSIFLENKFVSKNTNRVDNMRAFLNRGGPVYCWIVII